MSARDDGTVNLQAAADTWERWTDVAPSSSTGPLPEPPKGTDIGGYTIIDQGVSTRMSTFFNKFMRSKSSS